MSNLILCLKGQKDKIKQKLQRHTHTHIYLNDTISSITKIKPENKTPLVLLSPQVSVFLSPVTHCPHFLSFYSLLNLLLWGICPPLHTDYY